MKKEIAKKWVDALRSGDYEQAQQSLRRNDAYCCLGVLCEVYRTETGAGIWSNGAEPDFCVNGDSNDLMPPHPVMEWVELTPAFRDSLAQENDKYGKSFPEIASIIEKEAGL